MEGKKVVFRTLDMGGDKILSYYSSVTEANPFLGLRAIRFSLRHRGIFHHQLRGFLRAGIDASLRIMFPLISSVDEFLQAKSEVECCSRNLTKEGVAYNDHPELGVMIELPSAIEVIDELAQEADFLCIGSNDLVQYMLAVDRTNEELSHLYLSHHPAVLRALHRVVEAAKCYNKPLTLCGDMAGDIQLMPFLLGIGIRHFSVAPRWIPRVQNIVRTINIKQADKLAQKILSKGQVKEVEELIDTYRQENAR